MRKIIIGVSVLILGIAVSAGFYFAHSRVNRDQTKVVVEGATTSYRNGVVKNFIVNGTNFAFSPNTITVNKGDTVKITFTDSDGIHNLVIDGYNVATDVLSGGQQVVQFVADKTGQFEYYCSVGSHRDLGMTGTLIVQ